MNKLEDNARSVFSGLLSSAKNLGGFVLDLVNEGHLEGDELANAEQTVKKSVYDNCAEIIPPELRQVLFGNRMDDSTLIQYLKDATGDDPSVLESIMNQILSQVAQAEAALSFYLLRNNIIKVGQSLLYSRDAKEAWRERVIGMAGSENALVSIATYNYLMQELNKSLEEDLKFLFSENFGLLFAIACNGTGPCKQQWESQLLAIESQHKINLEKGVRQGSKTTLQLNNVVEPQQALITAVPDRFGPNRSQPAVVVKWKQLQEFGPSFRITKKPKGPDPKTWPYEIQYDPDFGEYTPFVEGGYTCMIQIGQNPAQDLAQWLQANGATFTQEPIALSLEQIKAKALIEALQGQPNMRDIIMDVGKDQGVFDNPSQVLERYPIQDLRDGSIPGGLLQNFAVNEVARSLLAPTLYMRIVAVDENDDTVTGKFMNVRVVNTDDGFQVPAFIGHVKRTEILNTISTIESPDGQVEEKRADVLIVGISRSSLVGATEQEYQEHTENRDKVQIEPSTALPLEGGFATPAVGQAVEGEVAQTSNDETVREARSEQSPGVTSRVAQALSSVKQQVPSVVSGAAGAVTDAVRRAPGAVTDAYDRSVLGARLDDSALGMLPTSTEAGYVGKIAEQAVRGKVAHHDEAVHRARSAEAPGATSRLTGLLPTTKEALTAPARSYLKSGPLTGAATGFLAATNEAMGGHLSGGAPMANPLSGAASAAVSKVGGAVSGALKVGEAAGTGIAVIQYIARAINSGAATEEQIQMFKANVCNSDPQNMTPDVQAACAKLGIDKYVQHLSRASESSPPPSQSSPSSPSAWERLKARASDAWQASPSRTDVANAALSTAATGIGRVNDALSPLPYRSSMDVHRVVQHAHEAEARAIEARRVAMRALAATRGTQHDPYGVLSSRVNASPFGVNVG